MTPRQCARCQAILPEGAQQCTQCGCPVHQQTLFGLPALPKPPRAQTMMYGQAVPLAEHPRSVAEPSITEPAPDAESDESTWVGPPEPAWATGEVAAPTLLDTHPPFRALTPADGHPALPASVAPTLTPLPEGLPAVNPDSLAAARFEAAIDATVDDAQHTATRRRRVVMGALIGLLLIGGVALWQAQRFRAELAGALTVTRVPSGYAITVGVKTSAPAQIEHPGGTHAVDGDAELRFEVAADGMQLGDNPIELIARDADGVEEVLTVHVLVHYHLRTPTPPRRDAPVVVDLTVQPGWRAELVGAGAIETRPDGVRLRVTPPADMRDLPADQLALLPIAFKLHSPDGVAHAFTEQLPLGPALPELTVLEPVRGWALTADRVFVRGRATPRAAVRIGAQTVTADAQGEFRAWVPLPAEGTHRLRIETQDPQPSVVEIDVQRLHPTIAATQLSRARATARGAPVIAWRTGLPDGRYAIDGVLISTERGAARRPDAAIVNTCPDRPTACPLQITLARAPLTPRGAPARVVGTVKAGALIDAQVLPR